MDKCNIYDFDYKTLSQMAIDDGKTVEDYGEIPTTKNCTEFVFDNKLSFDNSSFTSSIVTDVSKIFSSLLALYCRYIRTEPVSSFEMTISRIAWQTYRLSPIKESKSISIPSILMNFHGDESLKFWTKTIGYTVRTVQGLYLMKIRYLIDYFPLHSG